MKNDHLSQEGSRKERLLLYLLRSPTGTSKSTCLPLLQIRLPFYVVSLYPQRLCHKNLRIIFNPLLPLITVIQSQTPNQFCSMNVLSSQSMFTAESHWVSTLKQALCWAAAYVDGHVAYSLAQKADMR